MENKSQVVGQFKQFAQERLNNHLLELETRYENQAMSSKETVADAYKAHQKIYGNELDEKIKSLFESQKNDQAIRDLEEMRNTFYDKLRISDK